MTLCVYCMEEIHAPFNDNAPPWFTVENMGGNSYVCVHAPRELDDLMPSYHRPSDVVEEDES